MRTRLLFLLTFCFGLTALAQTDSVEVVNPLGGNAMDYVLQKRQISKKFENRRMMDHAFVEIGGGISEVIPRQKVRDAAKPGPLVSFGFGNWITPMHGWRFKAELGHYKFYNDAYKSRAYGAHIDYIFNISAFGHNVYNPYRPWRFVGFVGVGGHVSHSDDTMHELGEPNKFSFNLRAGVRAQLQMTSYSYVYAEPGLMLSDHNLFHIPEGYNAPHNFHLLANVEIGFGMAMPPLKGYKSPWNRSGNDTPKVETYKNGLDMFVSLSGGVSTMYNKPMNVEKKIEEGHSSDYRGKRFALSLGKFFTPIWGLRVNVAYAKNKLWDNLLMPVQSEDVTNVSVNPEALWNLNNTFAGYNPDRVVDVHAFAGMSANFTNHRKLAFGLDTGLQCNFRIAKNTYLFLEPRIDFVGQKYEALESNGWDVIPSLNAGLTYRFGR